MEEQKYIITAPDPWVLDNRTNLEKWIDALSDAEAHFHYVQIINKQSDLSATKRKLVVARFDKNTQ